MNSVTVIWRDSLDKDSWHLGMYNPKNGIAICWNTLFVDNIYDLFGDDFLKEVQQLNAGQMVQIDLSATVK